ncbi:hypothetical protein B4144_3051 [Bacillus atrophaeus]|nr:hypothetical protein B4144_3051 [Bacillus atrophaeus]
MLIRLQIVVFIKDLLKQKRGRTRLYHNMRTFLHLHKRCARAVEKGARYET